MPPSDRDIASVWNVAQAIRYIQTFAENLSVDQDILWTIIHSELSPLLAQLEALLPPLPDQNEP
jgi:hypothetical protein